VDDARFVRILKALGDPKRLRMVREIAKAGELSCGQIGERFHLSQPTISHHLKVLNDAGILQVREAGQHRFVTIDFGVIDEVTHLLPASLSPRSRRSRK
jgi:ArsR family transcriptional regulator